MDLLSQHEAFLRAIFDAPDDDTPRLVYADFLQENGEDDRAELIRVQCELVRRETAGEPVRDMIDLDRRQAEIGKRLGLSVLESDRGFPIFDGKARVHADALRKRRKLRTTLVRTRPHYFAATRFVLEGGLMDLPEQVDAMLALPVFANVCEISAGGEEVEIPNSDAFKLFTVITPAAVKALAEHPGAQRLTWLNLTRNNLLDATAQVLLESPYLVNLKHLYVSGNGISATMWQRLRERFGRDVVGWDY